MDTLLNLYSLFVKDKGKERFEIILEPMQAMTQLALMSFCPKGSKMSISNNLLTIQTPTWMQGLMRTYNHDKRDDLFFLFNVIIRFNKFYGYMKSQNNTDERRLFDIIVKLSKKGIDNILQTYAYSDQPSLLHTLQMYRTMLDKPEIFAVDNILGFNTKEKSNYKDKERDNNNNKDKNKNNNKERDNKERDNKEQQDQENKEDLSDSNSSNINNNSNSVKDIDDVFIKIRQIYNKSEFNIIYHNLLMLEKNQDHYESYMQAINASMHPVNLQIKKWINDNIVY
jgi:hypothetical protein